MKRKRVLLLLCILSCTLQLFAQQINVQGVVYDPSGETVPGANVSMKSNPAVGTVTDIDGNFSLKASFMVIFEKSTGISSGLMT